MAAPMFGVVVAGRLVQTNFQPIDETKFLISIPDADNVNHIVVFLTGAQPFPDEMGGLIYFSWPNTVTAPSWILLGHISNQKPSVIFKISRLKSGSSNIDPFGIQPVSHVAQIGISVEPLMQIEHQTPSAISNPSTMDSMQEFVNKMLENFFNYASSFSMSNIQLSITRDEMFIPLNTLQQWYLTFQRRLQQNPNFWKD